MQPSRDGDIDVAQLRQLVEIQTQIVKQTKQNQIAQQQLTGLRRKLTGSPRRLLGFISQLW
jgi:hypothetical protein